MAFDYDESRLDAFEIINDFGGSGSVVSKGSTGGFAQDGSILANSNDTTITGSISPLMSYKNNEIDGKSIIMGDSFVYFQADTNADKINVDTQVTLNSKTFKVKSVKDLSSITDINVFYKLQLRK